MGTPFKMKGPSLYKNSPMKQDKGKKVKLKDAARTGVGQFAGKAKKVLKEIFMPVSQQVKRNEKRRMKDFDKSMKSRMTSSEKAAYNRKYPNEKIK